ncbi:MAG: hypothetical protein IKO02_01185, partial [Lentisphaeria bacterium]|nr:hypothetical protein [Lentisphaeria bacterium]
QERLAFLHGGVQGERFFAHDEPYGDGCDEKKNANSLPDAVAFSKSVNDTVGCEKGRDRQNSCENHERDLFLGKKS